MATFRSVRSSQTKPNFLISYERAFAATENRCSEYISDVIWDMHASIQRNIRFLLPAGPDSTGAMHQQTDSEPDYAFFRIEVFRPSRDKPFHPAAKELAGGCEKQILVLIVCILPEVIEKVLEVLLVDLKP